MRSRVGAPLGPVSSREEDPPWLLSLRLEERPSEAQAEAVISRPGARVSPEARGGCTSLPDVQPLGW